jgi:hypothetical protein
MKIKIKGTKLEPLTIRATKLICGKVLSLINLTSKFKFKTFSKIPSEKWAVFSGFPANQKY